MAESVLRNNVKRTLLGKKVRLWEPPYFEDGHPNEAKMKEVAETVSGELQHPVDDIMAAMRELQDMAVVNLKNRDLFKEKGIATLTLRLAQKHFTTGIQDTDKLQVQIDLNQNGATLKAVVGSVIDVLDLSKIKCIVRGKVMEDDLPLASQGVRHDDSVMVMVTGDKDIKAEEALVREIEQIKRDSKALADGNELISGEYFQVTNQHGAPVDIPEDQRVALVTAMTLYETGRTCLKQQEYSKALLVFLEADAEFNKCNISLLDSVDNYALLNLDIVWCYLCLRTVTALPDAGRRLQSAEKTLTKAYGPNFERVNTIKAGAGGERANMLRLKLMQGILEYHHGHSDKAVQVLKGVTQDLGKLKVSDELVSEMVSLGHSAYEARLALRASGNDLQRAVMFVEEERNKKRAMREKRVAEAKKRRIERQLGYMPGNKVRVSAEFFENLVGMGYSEQQARIALIRGDNTVAKALDLLCSTPMSSDPEVARMTRELGFLPIEVDYALHFNGGDIRKATAALLDKKYASILGELPSPERRHRQLEASSSATSNASTSTSASSITEDSSTFEETTAAADEALGRLASAMPGRSDEYLDFSLDMEEKFLKDYLDLLGQVPQ